MTQISLFDGDTPLKITKPIRLIELFAGYGSQSLALKYLKVPFEHWKICEWAVKSIQAYKDLHFGDDTCDYSKAYSVDELIEMLLAKGISADYNAPMTREQIKRMGEQKIRTVYNNIIATNNLVSVCNTTANDLEITDTDKYTYIMTYSFPCQDLSKAGNGAGMAKGSGTRSGMLWEVERILDECNGNLPQILLMENVPDVIGANNVKHFAQWVKKLEQLGYTSKWQCLNAKDYSVPQNRDRCFMVSWLGNHYYDFPTPIKLEKRLKDVLETNVDEKYYLDDDTIERISKWKSQQQPLKNILNGNSCSPCLTARGAGEEHSGMILLGMLGGEPLALDEQNGYIRQDGTVGTLTTDGSSPKHNNRVVENYRIRKLTPKECGRLMGVRDDDIDKMSVNQSNSSLFHCFGDSIVVDVLMAIFKQMI